MTDLRVDVSKVINAPIKHVFEAWLDAKLLSQFMMPMPGMPNPRTECDPQVGGEFAIFMMVGEEEIPHTGKYLEINRPNQIVFTWNSPFSTDGSLVTINLKEIDKNKTSVELTHTKFPNEESRSNHEGGWGNILLELNQLFK
ncbi:MAG: SRPBCC family protein [Kangiellaceae bacterium]